MTELRTLTVRIVNATFVHPLTVSVQVMSIVFDSSIYGRARLVEWQSETKPHLSMND